MTKTMSMRVEPHQAEQIEAAAIAANLKVGPYLYHRVTDTPILYTPALAALAELICTLRRIENTGCADCEVLDALRAMIIQLSRRLAQGDDDR